MTKWIVGWRRNGWRTSDGKPVKNKALITYLRILLDLRFAMGQIVRLEHVKGHAGIEGNECADTQANLGAQLPQISEEPDWDAKRLAVEERIAAISRGPDQVELLEVMHKAPFLFFTVLTLLQGGTRNPGRVRWRRTLVPYPRYVRSKPGVTGIQGLSDEAVDVNFKRLLRGVEDSIAISRTEDTAEALHCRTY